MRLTWGLCACINAISATLNLGAILLGGAGIEHKIAFGVSFSLMLVSLCLSVAED